MGYVYKHRGAIMGYDCLDGGLYKALFTVDKDAVELLS